MIIHTFAYFCILHLHSNTPLRSNATVRCGQRSIMKKPPAKAVIFSWLVCIVPLERILWEIRRLLPSHNSAFAEMREIVPPCFERARLSPYENGYRNFRNPRPKTFLQSGL